MSDKRLDHVRSLVLDIERLKGEHTRIGEHIATMEHELSSVLGGGQGKAASKTSSAPTPTHHAAAAQAPAPAAAPTASKKASSGSAAERAEQLLHIITEHPGLRNEQLRDRVPFSSIEVKAALTILRGRKQVKTDGTRRAMTYVAAGAGSGGHASPAPSAQVPAVAKAAKAAKPRKASKRAKGGRRTSVQVNADDARILAHITAHPSLRSEDIQKALAMPKPDIASGLQRLREAGTINMTGIKRAATYLKA